ncbi:hypothetical protein DUNSADRAFT_17603 [Dunaliella salina]|uniref:Encoded protein n=1 Tax=Dunaliella salina TaxID=3046 RepID=A0ABQ7G1F8_DUNSA|nr:hypothetical protein DUNSADRAFT_17603 [Dunaliella salina]|eukprot:KAF5828440.1 hypothetical protein DUNSADRAFT_17603 [Dunaliella salina]
MHPAEPGWQGHTMNSAVFTTGWLLDWLQVSSRSMLGTQCRNRKAGMLAVWMYMSSALHICWKSTRKSRQVMDMLCIPNNGRHAGCVSTPALFQLSAGKVLT